MSAVAAQSKPIVYYWAGIKSRNFYMALMAAGTGNADNVEFKGSDSAGAAIPYPGTAEWDQVAPQTKSVWGLLPTLVDESSGTYIGESGAITRWLQKKFGVEPDDMKLYALSEQAIEKVGEIHNVLSGAHYSPDRTAAMDALFTAGSKLHKILAGFEKVFADDGTPWMAGTATPGDYMIAGSFMILAWLQPDSLDEFPKCKALHDHVAGMESIKAYLETVPYTYFKRNSDE
jgi:glutathione S-transferase